MKFSGMETGNVKLNCDNEPMDDGTKMEKSADDKRLHRNLFDLTEFDSESEVIVSFKEYRLVAHPITL